MRNRYPGPAPIKLRLFLGFLLIIGTATLSSCSANRISIGGPLHAGRTASPPVLEDFKDGLSTAEAESLSSLERIDEYPLYTMYLYGAYGDGGLESDSFIPPETKQSRLADRFSWGCSLFVTLGNEENKLFGRNFDWSYSPALLLYTDPPGGYAAVSMVDIAYLGFSDSNSKSILELPLVERKSLLRAPYLPFDGMNEHGLVVGMAAVPAQRIPFNPALETVDSLLIIRLLLDQARNVDEALELFRNVNLDWGSGPALHYLIADRTGRAVLVEFNEGELLVIENQEPWHLATNFLQSSVGDPTGSECWRFNTIEHTLVEHNGQLDPEEAMKLLGQVSQGNTQWSIIYDLENGEVSVTMGRNYDHPQSLDFHLEPLSKSLSR